MKKLDEIQQADRVMHSGRSPHQSQRRLWVRWLLLAVAWGLPSGANAQRPAPFDHEPFARLLHEHVTEEGLVDYDAFDAAPEFTAYLASLSDANVARMDASELLALWINAYNAYTIELINRHEERSSIRNINKVLGLFAGRGPWNERLAHVGGSSYTLDEIEHEIIREEFGEPRIHFALVCAALGCPPLRREPYVGDRLDAQLDDQARRFLTAAPAKNRVDVEAGTLYLSRVFDWYRDDFPEGDRGLGEYLSAYFEDSVTRTFLRTGEFEIEYTHYDWQLNGRY